VGAGVHHSIGHVVLREVGVRRIAIEGELKNACPGYAELVAECVHIRCDQPEVFGDEWQSTQLCLYHSKEINAGSGHPLALLGCRGTGGDVPCAREPAEVIQPNHVHVRQQGTEAVYAPTVAGMSTTFRRSWT
jgi:hypothetical protein